MTAAVVRARRGNASEGREPTGHGEEITSRLVGSMNRLAEHAHRGARRVTTAAKELRTSPVLQHAAAARERGNLEAALAELPQEQRTAIVLCDVEGLDYAEIAVAMKTSLGTVKSRIARARMKMRDIMLRQPELLPTRFRQGG